MLEQGEREGRARLGTFVVVTVIAAAFGPYIVGTSVRSEQAVIYGTLIVLLPFTLPRLSIPKFGGLICLVWAAYAAVGLMGALNSDDIISRWPVGSIPAGIDNLVLPMATMLLIWLAVPRSAAAELLSLAGRLIAYATAANGVLAAVMTQIDLSALMRPFVAPGETGSTVAERAAELGRVAGIFGQPAEAGLAYGIGGLAACYVWRDNPRRMYLVLLPIIIGGLLCVSKIFILVGLPLILWRVWRTHKVSRVRLILLATVIVVGISESGMAKQWLGFEYLARLFSPSVNADIVNFYTAGRLGGSSTLSAVTDEVARIGPWFGVGASGLRVAYDNGWVEAFVVAGIAGIICYSATLVIIFSMGWSDADISRRALITSLAIFAAVGSLGVPALTANRSGTLLWVLVALVSLAHSRRTFRQAGEAVWSRIAEPPPQTTTRAKKVTSRQGVSPIPGREPMALKGSPRQKHS